MLGGSGPLFIHCMASSMAAECVERVKGFSNRPPWLGNGKTDWILDGLPSPAESRPPTSLQLCSTARHLICACNIIYRKCTKWMNNERTNEQKKLVPNSSQSTITFWGFLFYRHIKSKKRIAEVCAFAFPMEFRQTRVFWMWSLELLGVWVESVEWIRTLTMLFLRLMFGTEFKDQLLSWFNYNEKNIILLF